MLVRNDEGLVWQRRAVAALRRLDRPDRRSHKDVEEAGERRTEGRRDPEPVPHGES